MRGRDLIERRGGVARPRRCMHRPRAAWDSFYESESGRARVSLTSREKSIDLPSDVSN